MVSTAFACLSILTGNCRLGIFFFLLILSTTSLNDSCTTQGLAGQQNVWCLFLLLSRYICGASYSEPLLEYSFILYLCMCYWSLSVSCSFMLLLVGVLEGNPFCDTFGSSTQVTLSEMRLASQNTSSIFGPEQSFERNGINSCSSDVTLRLWGPVVYPPYLTSSLHHQYMANKWKPLN